MSELKTTGKIKLIGDIQTFDSGFKKLEFVITTNDQYPQDIKFEIVKEKADDFKKFNKVGDMVDVKFNLRGNEWKDKYYVSLQAWSVFKVKEEETVTETTQENEPSVLPF